MRYAFAFALVRAGAAPVSAEESSLLGPDHFCWLRAGAWPHFAVFGSRRQLVLPDFEKCCRRTYGKGGANAGSVERNARVFLGRSPPPRGHRPGLVWDLVFSPPANLALYAGPSRRCP